MCPIRITSLLRKLSFLNQNKCQHQKYRCLTEAGVSTVVERKKQMCKANFPCNEGYNKDR